MIGWTSHIFGRVIQISKAVFLEGAANTWLEVWCVSAPCDITKGRSLKLADILMD